METQILGVSAGGCCMQAKDQISHSFRNEVTLWDSLHQQSTSAHRRPGSVPAAAARCLTAPHSLGLLILSGGSYSFVYRELYRGAQAKVQIGAPFLTVYVRLFGCLGGRSIMILASGARV